MKGRGLVSLLAVLRKSQLFSHYRRNLAEGFQTLAILRDVCRAEIGRGSWLGRFGRSGSVIHVESLSPLCPSVTIAGKRWRGFSRRNLLSKLCLMPMSNAIWFASLKVKLSLLEGNQPLVYSLYLPISFAYCFQKNTGKQYFKKVKPKKTKYILTRVNPMEKFQHIWLKFDFYTSLQWRFYLYKCSSH